jgi:hypothetical protein
MPLRPPDRPPGEDQVQVARRLGRVRAPAVRLRGAKPGQHLVQFEERIPIRQV